MRWCYLPSQLSGKLLNFLNDIGHLWIVIDETGLQIPQTSRANLLAVFHGKQIMDMQLHGNPMSTDLRFRDPYITETAAERYPRRTIVNLRTRYETDAFAGAKYTTEVL